MSSQGTQQDTGARSTPPEITDDMRASAKQNPNTWLYVMDPAFEAGDDVPDWGVIGAYPVDGEGNVEDGNFHPNDQYLPSPQALNLPLPTNELERLMQLVHTQHEPASVLPPAILKATLYVYAEVGGTPDDPPAIRTTTGQDGRTVVPACTAEHEVPPSWPNWREMSGEQLVPLLGEHPLALNPEGVVTALVPVEHLVKHMAAEHTGGEHSGDRYATSADEQAAWPDEQADADD